MRLVPEILGRLGFRNIIHVPEQDISDGNFPTVVSPNPEEPAALKLALDKAEETGADLVMGTDPTPTAWESRCATTREGWC